MKESGEGDGKGPSYIKSRTLCLLTSKSPLKTTARIVDGGIVTRGRYCLEVYCKALFTGGGR